MSEAGSSAAVEGVLDGNREGSGSGMKNFQNLNFIMFPPTRDGGREQRRCELSAEIAQLKMTT